MKQGMVVYAVITLVVAWLLGITALLFQDALGQYAGLIMLPLAAVPLAAAYIAHRASGAVGNPFAGLVWGKGIWIFAAWLSGLLIGYVVVVLSLGLKLQGLDLEMSSYLAMLQQQSLERGQELPESALGMMKTGGVIAAFVSPLLGAWFFAATGCLGTFPWLGWFGRRLLVHGKAYTAWTLVAVFALTTIPTGFMATPQLPGVDTPVRLLLMAFAGVSSVPLILWLFLKTRSAVIPAVVQGGTQGALGGMVPLLTQGSNLLCPPVGMLTYVVILGAGLTLWIWKDPGGDDLAIASVAYDGTPLTPEMVKQLDAEESKLDTSHEPAPPAVEPPAHDQQGDA